MGIVRNQPGSSSLAAGAGSIIGTAKKKEAEHEQKMQADRMAAQLAGQQMAIKARQQQQEAAMKWDQEKMAMRSAQDFQQEQRDAQREMDKMNMAKDWELEKMAIRSQQELADELRETQEVKNEASATIKTIEEGVRNGKWNEGEVDQQLKRAYLQKETGTRGYAGDFSGRGDYGMPPWYENPDDPAAVAEKGLRTLEDERQKMEDYTGLSGLPLPALKEEYDAMVQANTPKEIGQIISAPDGTDYRVVGFDEDGEPLVNPVAKRNKYGGYGASGSW